MIICDILKRRFEFELKPDGYDKPVPIEKNGIQYFRIPFNYIVAFSPYSTKTYPCASLREIKKPDYFATQTIPTTS